MSEDVEPGDPGEPSAGSRQEGKPAASATPPEKPYAERNLWEGGDPKTWRERFAVESLRMVALAAMVCIGGCFWWIIGPSALRIWEKRPRGPWGWIVVGAGLGYAVFRAMLEVYSKESEPPASEPTPGSSPEEEEARRWEERKKRRLADQTWPPPVKATFGCLLITLGALLAGGVALLAIFLASGPDAMWRVIRYVGDHE